MTCRKFFGPLRAFSALRLITVSAVVVFFIALGSQAHPSTAMAADAGKAAEPVTAKAEKALVRIDTNGSFVGVGVVVSANGHVLTSLQTAGNWTYAKFTVGDARVPAAVCGIDQAHGLALLCATATLGEPETVASTRSPKDSPVTLIGYRRISSEPPMVAKRKDDGTIANPTYVGESSDTLDLRDLMIVRMLHQGDIGAYTGSPVISSKTGEMEGFVIGHLQPRYDVSDLIVMPASVIRTFLQAKKVPLP